MMGSIEKPLKASNGAAASALRKLKDRIIGEWEATVRSEISAATHIERPVLIDTLPSLIDNLAQALDPHHPRQNAVSGTNIPEMHVGERGRLTTYGPGEVVAEYQILRDVILDQLGQAVELTNGERTIVRRTIDLSIRRAIGSYCDFHSAVREQFVASLSHDLRQPLNVAKMSAELMAGAPPDEIADLRGKIITSIDRADRMISDLLDVVSGMGEPLTLHPSKGDLRGLVEQVVKQLEPQFQARVEVRGPTCQVHWDVSAVQRALHNLINNAFKYGDQSAPVRIDLKCGQGRAGMAVHNEGSYITPEIQRIIFEPFRRAQKGRDGKSGWGIGLAQVRAVAESHGGDVVVDSGEGRGTNFVLNLPAQMVDVGPL